MLACVLCGYYKHFFNQIGKFSSKATRCSKVFGRLLFPISSEGILKMAVVGCPVGKCLTLTWKLENMSYCWQKNEEPIRSPIFVVDALEGTRWTLSLYPRGYEDGNYIGYFLDRDADCSRANDIEIDYVLSFAAADGSALQESKVIKRAMPKGKGFGWENFVTTEEVFLGTDHVSCQMTR
ncbi:speckle-type POZ protein B [Caerostris extrusa]|uniref:Speckle-type POZ protein B n=1 Tax=Caerostris extrusa TaxID=172846 RepID=A0AAV4Q3G8_CAEEX|nr:speckle-type POZ protein B [Caerostris extrusa]